MTYEKILRMKGLRLQLMIALEKEQTAEDKGCSWDEQVRLAKNRIKITEDLNELEKEFFTKKNGGI